MSLVVLVFMPKVLAALAYGFLWAAGWNPLDNTDPKKPQVRVWVWVYGEWGVIFGSISPPLNWLVAGTFIIHHRRHDAADRFIHAPTTIYACLRKQTGPAPRVL